MIYFLAYLCLLRNHRSSTTKITQIIKTSCIAWIAIIWICFDRATRTNTQKICYNSQMKNTKHILSELLKNTQYQQLAKRLQTRKNLESLKLVLPLDMQKNILKITYKPPKILFCFNPPSYASEFNHYRKNQIISCLKEHQELFSEIIKTPTIEALEVQAWVPKNILEYYQTPIKQDNQSFSEHSNGTFKNLAKDKQIYQKFEEIRSLILCLNNSAPK